MKKPIDILRKARDEINQAIDKLVESPDVDRVSCDKECELGTQYILSDGAIFKYGKVDFGILGTDNNGGEIRYIWYGWFPMNGVARFKRGTCYETP